MFRTERVGTLFRNIPIRPSQTVSTLHDRYTYSSSAGGEKKLTISPLKGEISRRTAVLAVCKCYANDIYEVCRNDGPKLGVFEPHHKGGGPLLVIPGNGCSGLFRTADPGTVFRNVPNGYDFLFRQA